MEYISGLQLGELLEIQTCTAGVEVLRSTLRTLSALHSFKEPDDGFTPLFSLPDAVTHWGGSQSSPLLHRLEQLQAFFPDIFPSIYSHGFQCLTQKADFSFGPLAVALESLRERLKSRPPLTRSLVHGDLKLENILLQKQGVRFIDPHLAFADPLVDYSRLYYWLLTSELLSVPLLGPGQRRRWGELASDPKKPDRSIYIIEFTSNPKAKRLVRDMFDVLKVNTWDLQTRGRFHFCCGVTLLWQVARLSETLTTGVHRKALAHLRSVKRNDSAVLLLRESSGTEIAKATGHLVFALYLGASHVWTAAHLLADGDGESFSDGDPLSWMEI